MSCFPGAAADLISIPFSLFRLPGGPSDAGFVSLAAYKRLDTRCEAHRGTAAHPTWLLLTGWQTNRTEYSASAAAPCPGGSCYGGNRVFHGPAHTIKCFECNTLVRKALEGPGNGQVLVVDGRGSTRCALVGDQLGVLAVKNGWKVRGRTTSSRVGGMD